MKRLSTILLANLLLASVQVNAATEITCPPTFDNKPFYDAVIYGNPRHPDYGPAECTYGFPGTDDFSYYKLPQDINYTSVDDDNWVSVMPGILWCGVMNGHTYNQCAFTAK